MRDRSREYRRKREEVLVRIGVPHEALPHTLIPAAEASQVNPVTHTNSITVPIHNPSEEIQQLFMRASMWLIEIKVLVKAVRRECSTYCIPSFKSKAQIVSRIDSLKCQLMLSISKAEASLKRLTEAERAHTLSERLSHSINTHFRLKLDQMLAQVSLSLQEIDRERVTSGGISTPNINSTSIDTTNTTTEEVYKSVHHICSTIKALKGVVLSQSEKIERLDMAMELATAAAEKSKREISSISSFGSHAKSRIISVLFFSILLLIVLSVIKAYMHSK